ncbi:MAG: SEC-C domain-containing protein [Idiomarina sp.]|nr:SEC-C domain-containing protein [Idiomarina sp.]
MKTGRNEPCPCGSGKKFKRCCMAKGSQQSSELRDAIEQTLTMNPNLSIDDLNAVVAQRAEEMNNRPNADFCGLTPSQMQNWLYAPFNELQKISIQIPSDLSASPVMRYLELIVDTILEQGGTMKATPKGNLPAKLVKAASELLPEFAVAEFNKTVSISEFAGSNEDKFNALHYTRILAELADIIYIERGKFYISKWAQEQYQAQGMTAFFPVLLEMATTRYNWGYLDGWEDDIPLREFWVFMLWRLQTHGSVAQLVDETATAFPDVLKHFQDEDYRPPKEQLGVLIETRFLSRFLEFFGFIVIDPKRFIDGQFVSPKLACQALLQQTFRFSL